MRTVDTVGDGTGAEDEIIVVEMPPDAVIRVGTKEPSMDVDRVGESEVDRDDEDISRVEMGNENEKEKALVEVVVVGRGEEGEVGVGSFVVKDGRVSTNKDPDVVCSLRSEGVEAETDIASNKSWNGKCAENN
ncbi:hypothetical protein RhiTH_002030 [Rhizoctonia solani]